jgi:hypothetical protein
MLYMLAMLGLVYMLARIIVYDCYAGWLRWIAMLAM